MTDSLTKVLCTTDGDGWQFRNDAAQILENGNSRDSLRVSVKKFYWLSKATDKLEGSMAVYLDSWTVAQQVLVREKFKVGPSLATVREFVNRNGLRGAITVIGTDTPRRNATTQPDVATASNEELPRHKPGQMCLVFESTQSH